MTAPPLLDVHDLTVEFSTRRGIVKAVQHVNISVAKGETLGIVGESGSGKSVTMPSVSPLPTEMSTCCTAFTMPRRVANSTVRSWMSRSG